MMLILIFLFLFFSIRCVADMVQTRQDNSAWEMCLLGYKFDSLRVFV